MKSVIGAKRAATRGSFDKIIYNFDTFEWDVASSNACHPGGRTLCTIGHRNYMSFDWKIPSNEIEKLVLAEMELRLGFISNSATRCSYKREIKNLKKKLKVNEEPEDCDCGNNCRTQRQVAG